MTECMARHDFYQYLGRDRGIAHEGENGGARKLRVAELAHCMRRFVALLPEQGARFFRRTIRLLARLLGIALVNQGPCEIGGQGFADRRALHKRAMRLEDPRDVTAKHAHRPTFFLRDRAPVCRRTLPDKRDYCIVRLR